MTDVTAGRLFDDPAFADVPADMRAIKDIAFSGDGEPTTCKRFRTCLKIVAAVRREFDLQDAKLVLITDACYLTRPKVAASLRTLDDNNGEIWAKLDAGTGDYFRRVNRPNYPIQRVIDNITAAARKHRVAIQSLFMRIAGEAPPEPELAAYIDRLKEISDAGGRIDRVQVYTIARRPAESFVTPLTRDEVDRIAQQVRDQTQLPVETFYGPT